MLYTKTKKKSIVLYNEGGTGPGGGTGGGGGVSSSPYSDNWLLELFNFLLISL